MALRPVIGRRFGSLFVDTSGDGEPGPPGPEGPAGAEGEEGPPGPAGSSTDIRTETGALLPSEPSLQAEWLQVSSRPDENRNVLSPHQRIPRVTVTCATDSNVNVANAPAAVGGTVMTSAQKVWLRNQTNPSENGIWTRPRLGGALVRNTKIDEIIAGAAAYVWVLDGTFGGRFFRVWGAEGIQTLELSPTGGSWSEVDIDDYYLDSDANDWAPAFNRAQEALEQGGTIHFRRRNTYDFASTLLIQKALTIRGSNVGRALSSGTRLRFPIGVPGIRTIHALDPGYTTIVSHWSNIEQLLLSYNGLAIEAMDIHGIELATPATVRDCMIYNFPGNGVHIVADVTVSPPSGANLVKCEGVRAYNCGMWGFYAQGGDANACLFIGCDATLNGQREKGGARTVGWMRITDTVGAGPRVFAPNTLWTNSGLFSDYFFRYYNVAEVTVPSGGSVDVLFSAQQAGAKYNLPGNDTIVAFIHDVPGSVPPSATVGLTVTNPALEVGNTTWIQTEGVDLDGGAFWDNSFLGNYYFGCHAASNKGHSYRSRSLSGQKGGYIICYSEDPPSCWIEGPNVVVGGLMNQDPSKPPMPGLHGIGASSGVMMRDVSFRTSGAKNIVARVARALADEVLHLTDNTDLAGVKLARVGGGRLLNSWAWVHGVSQAFGITDGNDQRLAGHAIAPRGIITGSPGIRIGSGLTAVGLPVNSTTTDVWNKGDMFYFSDATTGNAWEHVCTVKAAGPAPNALTWVVLRTFP